MGLSKLSTEEEQKYQQILDTPVDVNSLNTTKINRYSEKAVAETAVKLKAAVDAAAVAKAASEKATAEAIVTPEQQKQLADAEAAAKVATDKLALVKGQLERLNAGKGRSFAAAQ